MAGNDFNALNNLFQEAVKEEERRQDARNTGAKASSTIVLGGGSSAPAGAKKVEESKRKSPSEKDPNAIWDDGEVDTPHMAALKIDDGRKKPEYDIVYKQSVGSETVYFGMDDVDPSSNCCQEIVLKIKLPGQQYKDLDLDIQKQSMIVSSPDYRLATYLPYPVDYERGAAKWLSEKSILSITLPIVEE